MKQIMKVLGVLFTMCMLLTPICKSENMTSSSTMNTLLVEMPSSIFTYNGKQGGSIYLEWKLSKYTGDSYDGQTAYEMVKWAVENAEGVGDLNFSRWGVTRSDENYFYGYAIIDYISSEPCTITITNLASPETTVVVEMSGW